MVERDTLSNLRGALESDPLSPYIFIIYTEYFDRFIYFLANQRKSGIGINLNKDRPNIPYLMFADGCNIMYRVIKGAVDNVNHILDHRYKVSHHVVNDYISKIQFQKGVLNADKKGDLSNSSNFFG